MTISRNWSPLCGALCLVCFLQGTLSANTTYTYTGDAYAPTDCQGTYCTGGPYSLTITFDTTLTGAALDNLVLSGGFPGNMTEDVVSFSFADGSGLDITQNSPNLSDYFDIATNSSGNITSWNICALSSPSVYTGGCPGTAIPNAETLVSDAYSLNTSGTGNIGDNSGNYVGDFTSINQGANTVAGTWTSTATPEPGTWLLLGGGLLALVLFKPRSRRI
jgi:PEP-CTERM motif